MENAANFADAVRQTFEAYTEAVSAAATTLSPAIADLVRSFEAYFEEHRVCNGLAGGILEVTENGVLWGVARLECRACGVRWERRLAV
jgi:hypothetical protein